MRSAQRWRLLLGALAVSGCAESETRFGPGLDLQVQVADATLMKGSLPADEGGPAVSQVLRPQREVARGEGTVQLGGRLGPRGVALHVQARGDRDHWLIQPDGFDFVVADELLWGAQLAFSHSIAVSELDLLLQAADADGRRGPIAQTTFTILPDVPPAVLHISLGWDNAVDLDLHVQTPDGTVVGAKNVNSYEPPVGTAPLPDAWMDGGWLDFDSNKQCRLDLRNRENVLWLNSTPASGLYRVYVDLFSPCEEPSANFSVVVQHNARVLHEVSSTLYPYDAAEHFSEGEAPGLLVVEFELR